MRYGVLQQRLDRLSESERVGGQKIDGVRFSRTLDKLGISYNTQGLIYFLCVNAKRLPEQDKAVLNMCLEVAGEDYQALYKFLTDSSVNHVYIQMQYGLHPKRLFNLKREIL